MSKELCFLQITAEHQDCPFFTVSIFNHKNFIPEISQYSDRFLLNLTNIKAAIGEKSSSERFW